MSRQPLALRAHHGLCLLHFRGNGYSSGFTQNMANLEKELAAFPQKEIRLCGEADVLCGACPHRRGRGCESEKPERYDARVAELCRLPLGSVLSWGDFRRILLEKIGNPGSLGQVCAGCQWFDFCRNLIVENSVESVEKPVKNTIGNKQKAK